jgi:ADP-ribosylglycohydrolase
VARPDLSEALRGGLLGVAVGEALGLPWIGRSPREIKRDRLLDEVGPTGALTAAVLAAAGGGQSPSAVAEGGRQSPALAIALVVGWREDDPAARRAAALPLGLGAIVVADLAAQALAGRALYQQVNDHGKHWGPPYRGVGADDRAVIGALLANLHRHDDPSEAMRAAVRLGGGGTALLTALVGGILGVRRPTAITRVPWLRRSAAPDEAVLDGAVAALVASRQP